VLNLATHHLPESSKIVSSQFRVINDLDATYLPENNGYNVIELLALIDQFCITYSSTLCIRVLYLLFLNVLLSAQCVSSIGQIIKSVCVSVSESVSQ